MIRILQILLGRLSASSADAADPRNDRFAARSLIVINGKQKELTDFNKNQLAQDSENNAIYEKYCQNVVTATPEALKTPCFQGFQAF